MGVGVKRVLLTAVCALAVALFAGGCKKGEGSGPVTAEEEAQLKASRQEMPAEAKAAMQGAMKSAGETKR